MRNSNLPGFLIIGAMKCGSTSLFHYLAAHPAISMSNIKEPGFFIREQNWDKGLAWYRSLFNDDGLLHGEASTGYSKKGLFDGVAERIHKTLPDIKLIYLVRDPVERLTSHYLHLYYEGSIPENSLEDALQSGRYPTLVNNGRYAWQLSEYLNYFPENNIKVVCYQDLKYYRIKTLQEVFTFLGVDPRVYSPEFEKTHHLSHQKQKVNRIGKWLNSGDYRTKLFHQIPGKLKKRFFYQNISPQLQLSESSLYYLRETYNKEKSSLAKITGRSFEHWSMSPPPEH